MPPHDAGDADEIPTVMGWDEKRVAEVHLDDEGQVIYLALDASWPEIVSADELGAGVLEAYGAALTVLNERAVAALEGAQPARLPRVVPMAQALRERIERRREQAEPGSGGHAAPATDGRPGGDSDAEERLESARQMADLAQAARGQTEAYMERMVAVRQEKHVHESADRTVTLTSTYGFPVELAIDEKWTDRRAEDLVSVLIALIDEAAEARRRTDEAIAAEFPETVALMSAAARS